MRIEKTFFNFAYKDIKTIVKKIIISFLILFLVLVSGQKIFAVDENTEETLIENEFQGGGTAQGWSGDDEEWNYELPFSFSFYGVEYDDINIGSNGMICLDSSEDCTFYPYPDLSDSYQGPFITPIGLDLETSEIYITETASYVIIRWESVQYDESDALNFEVLLHSNGNIKFNYGEQENPPLTEETIIGISKGDGETYTESAHNGKTDIDEIQTSVWGVFGPSAESFSPHNEAIGISPSSNLSITFDEDVYADSGDITIKKYDDESTVETISAASELISGWESDTITINPENDLVNGVRYYVLVDDDAIKNSSNAFYDGITDKDYWSFTVMPEGTDFTFSESFSSTSHKDSSETTATWSTTEGTISLPSFGNDWTGAAETENSSDIITSSSDIYSETSEPFVAYDENNYPMLTWTEWTGSAYEIYFTRWNGSAWTNADETTPGSENISNDDTDTNYYPRMAIDSSGYPHIIWQNDTEYSIYYTRWNGTAWVKADGETLGNEKISDTVEVLDVYAYVADIKLDSNDRPNILWRGTSVYGEDFYFTRWNGTQWTQADGTTPGYALATTNGAAALWVFYFTFALDDNNQAHILWTTENESDIHYTRWNGTAWTYANGSTPGAETLNGAPSTAGVMKIDSLNNPVVMYSDNDYVYFTKYDTTNGWVQSDGETPGAEQVATDGEYPKFYLDSSDNIYASWINFNGADQIYFSKSVDGNWLKMDNTSGVEDVSSDRESTGSIQYQDLAIFADSDGYPNIAWLQYEYTKQQVMFTKWNGSAWTNGDGETSGSEDITNSVQHLRNLHFTISSDDTLMFTWWRDYGNGNIHYYQHNPPDHYSPRIAQSTKINGDIEGITSATLTADDETPGESSIVYYLSNDGGSNWNEVESGEEFDFSSSGNDLRWKAALYKGSSPTINSLSISFSNTAYYTLTYTAGEGGSITGDSPQTVAEGSDGSAVTATADEGYHFVEWSDASTDNPRTDTNVTEDITVSASFAINEEDEEGDEEEDEDIDEVVEEEDEEESEEEDIDVIEAPVIHAFDIKKRSFELRIFIEPDFINQEVDLEMKLTRGSSEKKIERTRMVDENGEIETTIDDLEPGTKYKIKVKFSPKDQDNFSEYSNEENVKTKSDIEDEDNRPIHLEAEAKSINEIDLNWTDNCDEESGYLIERENEKGEFEQIGSTGKNKEKYRDGDVLPATEYFYRVRAFHGNGYSGYSNIASAITPVLSEGDDGYNFNEDSERKDESNDGNIFLDENQSADSSVNPLSTTLYNPNSEGRVLSASIFTSFSKKIFQFFGLALALLLISRIKTSLVLPLQQYPHQRFISRLFSIPFMKRKRGDDLWGTVFDNSTNQPIPNVRVELIGEDGKLKEQTATDEMGRFGFLPKEGTYTMSVNNGNYKIDGKEKNNYLYGKLYQGEPFTVKEDTPVIKLSIALDSDNFDWKGFAKKTIKNLNSNFRKCFNALSWLAFFVLFVFSAIILSKDCSVFNFLIFSLYVLFFALIILGLRKEKSFGKIFRKENNKPLPFFVVAFYDVLNKRINFAVTDAIGRFYLLLPKKEQGFVKIKGTTLEGEILQKQFEMKNKRGILNERIGI